MAPAASGQPVVILIVEDEPLIRLGGADALRDAGYEVIEAENANEAIDVLGRRKDIRIIFTDVNMPGSLSGLELAAIVRSRWPPIEIIITSGRPSPAASEMPLRSLFFPKPCDFGSLLSGIRSFAP